MTEQTAEQKAAAEKAAAEKPDTSHQKKYDGGDIPRVPSVPKK